MKRGRLLVATVFTLAVLGPLGALAERASATVTPE